MIRSHEGRLPVPGMRLFVALEVPEAVRREVARRVAGLRERLPQARLTWPMRCTAPIRRRRYTPSVSSGERGLYG